MVKVVNYQTKVLRKRFNLKTARLIPHNPKQLSLATMEVSNAEQNTSRILLIATVGVRAAKGTPQLRFTIFKRGYVWYTAVQGVSTRGEKNAIVTLQAIDSGVSGIPVGNTLYTLDIQNIAKGTTAYLVGPVNFSALSLSRN